MKIGILDCDYLHPSLQEKFGRQYSEMFTARFLALDPSLTFSTFSAIDGVLPEDLQACNAWLITGSRHDAYTHTPWVIALREWIVRAHDAKVKLVGICFGHQAIAKALGAEVSRAEKGWGAGCMVYPIQCHQPWMEPQLNAMSIIASHQDQVHSLPQNAVLLAGDDFCPHYSYQIGKHILTIQGHPEFNKEYDRAILNLRQSNFGEGVYEKALASLEQETNSDSIMRWILRFMQT